MHILKGPPLVTATLAIKCQHEFWEGTNQSTPYSYLDAWLTHDACHIQPTQFSGPCFFGPALVIKHGTDIGPEQSIKQLQLTAYHTPDTLPGPL
jgi:hypothetical protein